jgi:Transposase DDE domain group 1
VTECTGQRVLFSIKKKKVTPIFDGGNVTSDAGALFLKGIDERLGLIASMARAIGDRRQASKVEHEVEDLLRQRIFQICCGWEDANDADFLRSDPALQAALGKVPGERSLLASQPTISRLEEGICRRDVWKMSQVLLETYIARLRKAGRRE